MGNPWHLIVLSGLFMFTGVMHFLRPNGYVSVMPNYFSHKKLLVYISGVTEFLAGIFLLFSSTRVYAAISIIAMLVVFFTVHIYMLTPEYKSKIPRWILWVRLPLQFVLIYWAYTYI